MEQFTSKMLKAISRYRLRVREHKRSIISHMDGAHCISGAVAHEASLAHYGIKRQAADQS